MVENNTDRNNTKNLIVALGNIRGARATVGAIYLTLSIAGVGCAITTDGAFNDPIYVARLDVLSGIGLVESPMLNKSQKNICTGSVLNEGDDVLTIAHCTRVYARTLKAVSGPDDKGRWRFNSPYDAPTGAMESQGCEFATFSEPSYRCPDKTVELQDTRTLRAVSGPDDKGRWRFNSPGSDISNGAMESQGCEFATFDEPSWRCRDEKITVPIKH